MRLRQEYVPNYIVDTPMSRELPDTAPTKAAGAPNEIEITPEMIEAGAVASEGFTGGVDHWIDSPKLASAVYRAMEAARRKSR